MNQRHTAASLVRKHKTRDPFRIAEDRGYVVIRCPLRGVRGIYQHLQRRYVIYINSNLTDLEARFVCAHEIGHIMLHRGENRIFTDTNTYFQTNRQEIEANRFAVDLLYDDEDLRFFLEFPLQLAADFMGVSIELAEYRMQSVCNKAFSLS